LEQNPLYLSFKLDEAWNSPHNIELVAKMPAVYSTFEKEKNPTMTFYRAFKGPVSLIDGSRKLSFASFTDGTSNTAGVAEAGPAIEWTKPDDIHFDPSKAFPAITLPFANCVNMAMMDGSVRAFDPKMGEYYWRALADREDGINIDFEKIQPVLFADKAEELKALAEMIAANRKKLDEMNQVFNELNALHKLENHIFKDFDKAAKFGEEIDMMLGMFKPRVKMLRDGFGLPRGKPVPTPEELDRK
jgi:hypothetical protein